MFTPRIDQHLVSITAPESMEAEQYQSLRVKIERIHRERGVKVIAVTSPGAREGKSVTAANLAAALSLGSSARVLLIEADIRRPALTRYLALDELAGRSLSHLISDPNATLADAVQRKDGVEFDVLVAGTPDMPIHELLRSPRLANILAEAREHYDFVIVDTPPLGPVSDCALLARWVDGLLIVVAAHKTPRKLLESSLNQLDPSVVLGIVFNGDNRPLFGYHHAYYQGYSHRA